MAITISRTSERRASRYFRMRDLELLTALAHSGSMAKAAQALSISQPSVSKAIADLEASLGAKLLDRGFAGARLTVHGEVLARSAHLTLNELRQCLRDIDALSDPEAGEVRIGAPEAVTAGLGVGRRTETTQVRTGGPHARRLWGFEEFGRWAQVARRGQPGALGRQQAG